MCSLTANKGAFRPFAFALALACAQGAFAANVFWGTGTHSASEYAANLSNANVLVSNASGRFLVFDDANAYAIGGINLRNTNPEGADSAIFIDSGALNVNGAAYLGGSANTRGTLAVRGGALNSLTLAVASNIGSVGVFTQSGGAASVSSLLTACNGGASASLDISGGTLTAAQATLNSASGATATNSGAISTVMTVSGGTVRFVGSLNVNTAASNSYGASNAEIIVKDGGYLDATLGNFYTQIGRGANAAALLSVQTGGTATLTKMTVGDAVNATGALEIAGEDALLSTGYIAVANRSGATGIVSVSNGARLNTAAVTLGTNTGTNATGTMTVSGGTWSGTSLTLGTATGSQTLFTLVGGQASLSGNAVIGSISNAAAGVRLAGGAFAAKNIFVGGATSSLSTASAGALTISGGANTITESIIVGRAVRGTGTVSVTGGTTTIDGNLAVAPNFDNSQGNRGIYVQTGGTLHTQAGIYVGPNNADIQSNSAVMTVSGGTLSTAEFFNVGSSRNSGTASAQVYLTDTGALRATTISLMRAGTLSANGVRLGAAPLAQGEVSADYLLLSNGAALSASALTNAAGTLQISSGSMTTENLIIGAGSGQTASAIVSGGTATVSGALLTSRVAGASSSISLSGGTLDVFGSLTLNSSAAPTSSAGGDIVSEMTVSGTAVVGARSGIVFNNVQGNAYGSGSARLVVENGGVLNASLSNVYTQIGRGANGAATLSVRAGGTATVCKMAVGDCAGANAVGAVEATGSGALLTSGFTSVGNRSGSTGIVLVGTGATYAITSNLLLGLASHSTGILTLAGGTLTTAGLSVGTTAGASAIVRAQSGTLCAATLTIGRAADFRHEEGAYLTATNAAFLDGASASFLVKGAGFTPLSVAGTLKFAKGNTLVADLAQFNAATAFLGGTTSRRYTLLYALQVAATATPALAVDNVPSGYQARLEWETGSLVCTVWPQCAVESGTATTAEAADALGWWRPENTIWVRGANTRLTAGGEAVSYVGSRAVSGQARAALAQAQISPVASQLRARVAELYDAVCNDPGYWTMEYQRFPLFDQIDEPLNDSLWLRHNLDIADTLETASARASQIAQLVNRTQVGEGEFYYNFGDLGTDALTGIETDWNADPSRLQTAYRGYGIKMNSGFVVTPYGLSGDPVPRAWLVQAGIYYDRPLTMTVSGLDTSAAYRIRIAYVGEANRYGCHIKLTADGYTVHNAVRMTGDRVLEYDLPTAATADGSVVLQWRANSGERGVNIGEIFLLKK